MLEKTEKIVVREQIPSLGTLGGAALLLPCTCLLAILLAFLSCAEKTEVPRPISVENAAKVELLRSFEIPSYQKGRTSQSSLAFSPDGRLLACAAGIDPVCVWELRKGKIRYLLGDPLPQKVACAFSPDGQVLVSGGFGRSINSWNPETGQRGDLIGKHDSPIWELDFSPDGRRLVSASFSDDIRLWDLEKKP